MIGLAESDRHRAVEPAAADGEGHVAIADFAGGRSRSVKGSLLPLAGRAAAADLELAADVDRVRVALALDCHTQFAGASGVIGRAMDILASSVGVMKTAIAAPTSLQHLDWVRRLGWHAGTARQQPEARHDGFADRPPNCSHHCLPLNTPNDCRHGMT